MVCDRRAVRLHRQHQAGTNDLAVDAHRACAANPVLAADMRSGQLQMLAQEIRQIETRQNMRIDALAVDFERDWHGSRHAGLPAVSSGRPSSADAQRASSTFARCRRIEADACWSSCGIELFAKRRGGLGQYRGRDGDVDQLCRGLGQYRPIADGKVRKPQIGEDIAFHDRLRRQAGDGVIAVPPGEFVEEMRGILSRNRQFDSDQQFLRRQRRLINPLEEIPRPQPAVRRPDRER